ncbi:MAG: type II 3-dehydroquinate dehydratase [bacterium]
MNVLILHGPNMNFLGLRKPHIYGTLTLPQLNAQIRASAGALGLNTRIYQSNCEGKLIDLLAANFRWADRIIINPGALTHYSYSLRDAIEACGIPAMEVHLSDISRREPFRRKSVTAAVCVRQIAGRGIDSYLRALSFCARSAQKKRRKR